MPFLQLLGLAIVILLATDVQPAHSLDIYERTVSTAAELRNALVSGAQRVAVLRPIIVRQADWPSTVTISAPTTIFSPYRVVIQLCGDAECQGSSPRVLVNVTSTGSLSLERIFFKNFLPSTPQNLSNYGPIPALYSSGGPISFSLSLFHFLPRATWVFSAPPEQSFWARAASSTFTSLRGRQPLSLQQPNVYSVSVQGPQYSISSCYAPVDVQSCLDDSAPEDTVLVCCPYTFADAISNPWAIKARMFATGIGLDRVNFQRLSPQVSSTPMAFAPCPAMDTQPVLHMDHIVNAVLASSQTTFSGMRFRGSQATNFSTWPPAMSAMLSLFDVDRGGELLLDNCTVEVDDIRSVADSLRQLPGCCSGDPSRPNLQPQVDAWPSFSTGGGATNFQGGSGSGGSGSAAGSYGLSASDDGMGDGSSSGGAESPGGGSSAGGGGVGKVYVGKVGSGFTIRSWELSQDVWMQYASLMDVGPPSGARWRFANVRVEQADVALEASVCFSGALLQGRTTLGGIVRVADDLELREALAAKARYIQVVNDIVLSPTRWPSGPGALVLDTRITEVRACHPVRGARYTMNLSGLSDVVRSTGRLLLQGDIRFVGSGLGSLGPSTVAAAGMGLAEVAPLGAFVAAPGQWGGGGTVELHGVTIEAPLDTQGLGLLDLVTCLDLSHLTPAIRASNMTVDADGISLGAWSVNYTVNQTGMWDFVCTRIDWTRPPSTLTTGGRHEGGGRRSVSGVVSIVVPAVVCGTVVLVVLVLGAVAAVRWRRRQCGGDGGKESSNATRGLGTMSSLSRCTDPAPGHAQVHMMIVSRTSGLTDSIAVPCDGLEKSARVAASGAGGGGEGFGGTAGRPAGSGQPARQLKSPAAGRGEGSGGTGGGDGDEVLGSSSHESGAQLGLALAQAHALMGAAASLRNAEEAAARGSRSGAVSCPLTEINAAKEAIAAGRRWQGAGISSLDDILLTAVLGEGSYGTVYKALWRGTEVAVKVIHLPANVLGRERHAHMAVMEAAISSILSHPNIVQTYTFCVEAEDGPKSRFAALRAALRHGDAGMPLVLDGSTQMQEQQQQQQQHREQLQQPGGGTAVAAAEAGGQLSPGAVVGSPGPRHGAGPGGRGGTATRPQLLPGWEIWLVQEYCDEGSLRDKLDAQVFMRPAPSHLQQQEQQQQQQQHEEQHEQQHEHVAAEALVAHEAVLGSSAAVAAPTRSAATLTGLRPPLVRRLPGLHSGLGLGLGVDLLAEVGSLGQEQGGALQPQSPLPVLVDLSAVLDTAIDIARAVAHLHQEGIVHADLKPRNVLLKGSTTDPRGFVAKVADFGLSMRLDTHQSHASNAFHGTLSYMAPETLIHGHVSRASDVYAFGVMLYEMYTGEAPFKGTPPALLGHAISKDHVRPQFPASAPFEYQLLACRCWESEPEIRPSFIAILDELKRLRARLCGAAGGASTCRTGDGSSALAASRSRGGAGVGGRGRAGPLELTFSPPPAFANWTFTANASQGSMGSECSSEPSGGSNVGQDIRLSRQQGLKRSSQHTQRVPSVVGQSGSAPPTTRGGAHRLTHEDSHEHQHQLPRSHHVPHLHAMHQVRQQQVCDGMSDLQSQSKTGSVYLDTDTGVAAGPFTMPYAAMAMRMG